MLGDREYFVFDARACGDQGTGDAQVLSVASSLKEARIDARDFGACAIYEFVENEKGQMVEYCWLEDVT